MQFNVVVLRNKSTKLVGPGHERYMVVINGCGWMDGWMNDCDIYEDAGSIPGTR